MTSNYTASQIEILEGLDAVRRRPGMYIGSTGTTGLHHLIWEVVDNSVDEHLAGHANRIEVTIEADGAVTVRDDGRGIPIDKHPATGRPAAETVLTTLHAGGKFGEGGAYKVSGGLHGVGVAVVNALSEELRLSIERNGYVHTQNYEKGKPLGPLKRAGKTERTGTTISFRPDPEIFDTTVWDVPTIIARLREYAFLNRGLTIVFEDKREGAETHETYHFENGLLDFIADLTDDEEPTHKDIFFFDEQVNGARVQVAFRYIDSTRERVLSFANNVKTGDGGYHETGLRAALTRGINSYGREAGLLRGDETLSGDDVREGIVCVISVYLENPQFEGQTKNRLGNSYIRGLVETSVSERLHLWLTNNPNDAAKIIRNALQAKRARDAAKKARDAVRSSARKTGSGGLPGKLADCRAKNIEDRELFLVEGDSAGGTAKQARNRETQAIMPLRGKILNVERVRIDRVFQNEEIKNIIQVLGCGFGDELDLEKLRYGKIIILVDADVDGSHIATLLQTFFYRYMRELIEQGRVFFAQPPLYRVTKGSQKVYLRTDEELEEWKAKHGTSGMIVQRFKGLGEMQPEQLAEVAMNPETRELLRLTIDSAEEAEKTTSTLMGKSVLKRREMIQNHTLELEAIDA